MTKHDDDDMTSQLEFGWRSHSAQEAWTAKVDVKASVLLAAQVGLLVAIATIATATGFKHAPDWQWVILPFGVVLILAGGGLSAAAIFPQLSSSDGLATDLIYFGHLRKLKPEVVRDRLERLSEDDQLGALSRQLVQMSKVNWRKHRVLQWSIGVTVTGSVLAVVGLLLSF